MGELKTCDIHDKENNVVKAETTYKLYVQKEEKDGRKTLYTALFIGNVEGADGCHQCVMDTIIARMTGLGMKPNKDFTWRQFRWEQVPLTDGKGNVVKNPDGSPKTKNDRVFIDELSQEVKATSK